MLVLDLLLLLPHSGESYSHTAASPISTPNIGKRKSVNDRSVLFIRLVQSLDINDYFRKLRPKSVVDNGEGYTPLTPGPGSILSFHSEL